MPSAPGLLTLLLISSSAPVLGEPNGNVEDSPFIQEYHEPHPIGPLPGMNDVRAVTVDPTGAAWAASKAGVYRLKKGEKQWFPQVMKTVDGSPDAAAAARTNPTFDVGVDRNGVVWVGSWDGLYRSGRNGLEKIPGMEGPVAALCLKACGIVGAGPEGLWTIRQGEAAREPLPCARSVRRLYADQDDSLWIATGMGLVHRTMTGTTLYQTENEILSSDVYAVACDPNGHLWAGGLGGVTVFKDGNSIDRITPQQGLPSACVRSVCRAPDGMMWVGTTGGIARCDGRTWSVRHSRRWLLSDDVRHLAFDKEGTAWIATAGGVSAIRRSRMTLARKADQYLQVCLARHVRDPGLVEKCRLRVPGDVTTWEPRDDDNDGQYTGMYLAMESFRYGATRDPRARTNARRAFEALRFLQTVTGTSGFVARTVIPASWTRMSDPDEAISDSEWADRRMKDPREKRVANRWHLSSDGKWRWKGDTSSDELTGHMYGYVWYYDLAADEPEQEQVRAHVRRIVDYIVENGFVLKDVDGAHTRWGVWSPAKLNHDPDWAAERGVNSVEILSFLQAAFHMTGDAKYRNLALHLLREHDYAANVRHAKTYAPAWRTHIDDELLALAYPALLKYENDPELRRLYRDSLDHWYAGVKNDASPFFNFTYGGLVSRDPNLQDSVAFLRDAPLDLVRWRVDNRDREDLRRVRAPELEAVQTDRLPPPSERGVVRWDENPWVAVQGDGGETESDGVYWLLPYWMGRYHGFIRPPRED